MKELSRPAQIYILGTIYIGILLAIWQFWNLPSSGSGLLMLVCAAASLLQGLSVFGTTARSTYSLSWIIYGFTLILLGPASALVVIVVAHLAEWVLDRNRLKWYIQTFNIGTFAVSVTVAGLILSTDRLYVEPNSLLHFVLVLVSLAAFTLVNHLLVGWVIRLARGQSLSESGVFGWLTLVLDFTLLCLGYAATIIWETNPIALTLIALVAFLINESLKVPSLERKTEIDPKTELFNARYFSRVLNEELTRAIRFKRPLSIIMADLDLLRNINNTYGHLAGDVVLQGIAKILQTHTREYDVVARFGGEEFAVLLPETMAAEAYEVAERIRQEIESTGFVVTTSVEPIKATMSFGVSSHEGEEQTADSLVHNADVALYQAKANGRNQTCVFAHLVNEEMKSSPEESDPETVAEKITVATIAAAFSNGRLPASETPTKKTPMSEPVNIEHIHLPPAAVPYVPKPYPDWMTNVFIYGMALFVIPLAYYLVSTNSQPVDWFSLLFFSIVVLVVEASAIEIYLRDTSVSTSAALLIAGTLLYGPMGAIVLGIVIAFIAYAKRRSTNFNRLFFNANNHIFGGLLIVIVLDIIGEPSDTLSLVPLFLVGAVASLLVYFSTTFLLTIAIGLSNGHPFKAIWVERFRWLIYYYVVLGIVAATLVFSFRLAGLVGILVMVFPLLMLRYSQKQYIDHTEKMVHQLREFNTELIVQAQEITLLNEELLLTLARSIDLRDPYVMEHSMNVSRYAVCVAEELGLAGERVENVRKAGLLHDIGKLGVPERILIKPGRLTADEFEIVKEHVNIGAELVRGCHSLEPLVPFVRHHHEWFDGTGYPHRLAGDDIPLEARILSLADAVEAMASDRPYKKAMSPVDILEEVERWAGTQFDPIVTSAFARVIEQRGEELIVNSAREVIARQRDDSRTYAPHY